VEGKTALIEKKTYAIGVDVGGTTIKAGIVDRKGKILEQVSFDTKADKGPRVVMNQIVLTIEQLLEREKKGACLGIGVGMPGVVTPDDGLVRYPPNFADWEEVPVAANLRKVFALPIFIENDANAAAIGEATCGAGKAFKDFLFVIWGSGVGGGIILDHKIYRGPHGGAGEIGHVSVDYNGLLCNCGSKGCIEAYIGQRYLSKRTKEIIQNRPKDAFPSKIYDLVGGNLNKIEPAIISRAAEDGDPTAIAILQEAGEILGYGLASALNILDLRIVVIGGGVSAVPSFVYKAILDGLRSRVLKSHKTGVRVLRAELGNTAGIIGAASLAM
jgi:glucokinase